MEASFTNLKDDQIENNSRSIARPGVALSLSAGLHDIESPYSLKSTRDTTILKFSNELLFPSTVRDSTPFHVAVLIVEGN